ncbi:thioredoxin domain-containing protein [Anaerovorax odorimutans]|uniref:thioredoxin domain-containing protein n=1 Tax=Anaerovorax odorimutans TaxID=109327 RepID=UPI00042A0AA3|nr:thioredoxin domain-containing protein [Anaerovorax odorimutans]
MTEYKYTNNLINEKSPYLLQHAHNPVNWYPWGEEAFSKAKAEDKLIFLSIGYSTCHWCHVMEHESFEDEEVSEILNRDYVSIKVDKEERADIDSVYMTVCQGLTGQGGWPLTIIMTYDQKPFFAGTYFPKTRVYNMPGITEILNTMTKNWKENRAQVIDTADKIVKTLQKKGGEEASDNKGIYQNDNIRQLFIQAKEGFTSKYDKINGGFGNSPKFPIPHSLMFLLRYYKYEKDEQALNMTLSTLKHMYMGGIFDHVGFGFSRYSTDDKWLVPHFEKMIYDNALLSITYLEAYQITKKELYKIIAEKTLDYVLREMISEEGGFYSAQDADSEGIEGKYYVFTSDEITQLLGKLDGKAFNAYFGINEKPNFEDGSIPNLINNPLFSNENENYDKKIDQLCKKVYDYRLKRTSLHKDDKILTSWNALMLIAFAKAYGALENKKYLDAAVRCEEFISQKLINKENGKIYVRYRDNDSAGEGTLDDYAFYIWSLLTLYEVTFDIKYLDKAMFYIKVMKNLFWDEESGGFYLTANDSESLIYRPKAIYDGAIPSGNSVAGYVLVKLKKITSMQSIDDLCKKQLIFLEKNIKQYPEGYTFAMMALMMDYYTEGFLCENGVCS